MGMYGTDPRVQEKADMNDVNDRLATYINNVRKLRAGDTDSAAFMDTLRSLENDAKKMKSVYESELDKCRQQLDAANRQKNEALSEIEKYKRAAKDFEDRYRAGFDKNQFLINEIEGYKKRIADLERELAGAKSAAQNPQTVVSALQDDLRREQNKNKQLASELNDVTSKKKQLEDMVKALREKCDFSNTLSDEQMRDTNNRLEQAKKVISDMERKNRDLEKQCDSLPGVIDKMKKKTEQDLQQIKADMENSSKKNGDAIKKQLNDQNRTTEQLKADNAKLEKENLALMTRLRTLEAQVKDLNNQNAALEEQRRLERSKLCEQIRSLERKLKESQELLIDKMQEVNTGKDVTLRPEIEVAKHLLEMEEQRLNAGQSSSPTGYNRATLSSAASSQSGYNMIRLGSSCSDRQGANRATNGGRLTATKVPGKGGKFEQRTEYQSAYNKGGHFLYGSYGRSNKGGLPTLGTGKGNSGIRASMPN